MTELDWGRLARVLGLCGSVHDGEVLAAARAADKLIRGSGRTWLDLLKPSEELATVVEAAQVLVQENEELKAELARRRGAAAVALGHADDWYPGAAAQEKARWCLELCASGALYLNQWELTFLNSITEWKGRLTKRQEPVFERLLRRVAERVGRSPP
jgi:hypothetical protein